MPILQKTRRSFTALVLLVGPWLCDCRNDQPSAPVATAVVPPSSTAPSARASASQDAHAATSTVASAASPDAGVRAPMLAGVLATLKGSTKLPILLPTLERFEDGDAGALLFAQATGDADHFDVAVMAGADCGGAEACTIARLDAQRGASRLVGRSVALSRGIEGAYTPRSCGASCAPPGIQWVYQGVTYLLTFDGGGVEPLKNAANEAIEAGPR